MLLNFFPGKYELSRGQIDIMLSKKPRFRSKKWTNADYCTAMELRCRSTSALAYVRSNVIPMPAYSTLRAKFSFTHLTPGFMKPVLLYLSKVLPQKTLYQCVMALLFDETKVTNKASLDKKLDMIIGANANNVCDCVVMLIRK